MPGHQKVSEEGASAAVPVAAGPAALLALGELPVSAAPVGELPVSATPVGELTISAAPVGEFPVSAAPVGELPISAAPVAQLSAPLCYGPELSILHSSPTPTEQLVPLPAASLPTQEPPTCLTTLPLPPFPVALTSRPSAAPSFPARSWSPVGMGHRDSSWGPQGLCGPSGRALLPGPGTRIFPPFPRSCSCPRIEPRKTKTGAKRRPRQQCRGAACCARRLVHPEGTKMCARSEGGTTELKILFFPPHFCRLAHGPWQPPAWGCG